MGVILPKATLTGWGVGEGDVLELRERSIRPVARRGNSHQILDDLKRSLSLAVVRRCTPQEIRGQSLANLYRWKKQENRIAQLHWRLFPLS
jgi:hypothetical protein